MPKKLKALQHPKMIKDLRDLVVSNAQMYGDKALYIYKDNGEDRTFTYNDNLNDMNRLGTAFAEIGQLGKVTGVIGDTHPSYMTAYYATVNGNGTIVPLDKELGDEQLIGFINISEISALVYTASFNGRLTKLADKIPGVKHFIPIAPDEAEAADPLTTPYADLLALGQKLLDGGDRRYLDIEIDMEKMCSLIFTSGTTGTAKGVMLCQRNLAYATNASVHSMEYDTRNTLCSVLPLSHTYEVTCGHFAASNIGATITINDSLKNALRNFKHYKPNLLMVVPLFVETIHKRIWSEIEKKGMTKKVKAAMAMSNALLKVGIDVRDKLFSQITEPFGGELKSFVCGGAPLNPQLIKDFNSFGIFVLEGYGITECSPLVAVNRPGKERAHSVGTPVYGCEVKIDLSEGETTGEILVKGENVMLGYYRNEEATKEVFTDDGWFRTGDIGYMDKDGYIFITGRKKNVIILSNGKNVFPEEVEEYLGTIDTILETVVIGRKNDNNDIVITAVVYPDFTKYEGKTHDEILADIKASVNAVNKKLPVFKQVREVEIRDTEFEKTTTRKIKRFTVK